MNQTPAVAPARPRVLQCLTHLALGGAERIAFQLMRGLRTECDFAVFTALAAIPDAVGADMQRELGQTHLAHHRGTRAPFKLGGMALAGLGLARAVREFRPDIIHLHTEIPEASWAMMGVLSAAPREIPVVRTIHNSVFWESWPRLGRWCDRRLAHAHVAAVSQAALGAARQLRRDSGAGSFVAEPAIIYNGVDAGSGAPRAERSATDPVRLLFAGRCETQKGADLLPAILAAVRPPDERELELTIYGQGSLQPVLRALAAHPPAGWRVRLLAPVPDLTHRLRDFDLVLMPSRFEGLGLVAIEALQLGVPVIGTDAPGLREVFPEKYPWRARAGDAASFAHCLQEALGCAAAWAGAVQPAQAFVRQRFNSAQMCAGYLALYWRALGGG